MDNLGNTPMIELECGKVASKNLNLQKRPPSKQKKSGSSFSLSGMPSMAGLPPGMPAFPTIASFASGSVRPGINRLNILSNIFAVPSPTASKPDFSQWKIKTANDKGKSNASPAGTVKVRLPSNVLRGPKKGQGRAQGKGQVNSPVKSVASIQRPDRNRKPVNRKPTRNSRPKRPGGKTPGAGKVVSDGDEAVTENTLSKKTKSGM